MLLEIWDYLTTPASKEAKKEGFLYQSVALTHRARRCADTWGVHLETCHSLLAEAIQGKAGHVAVLGSGLMLETPIEDLCATFDKVSLIDVVHPKSIYPVLKGFPQVSLLELNLLRERPSEKYDFVISANLLSQLPLGQTEKLKKIGYSHELIQQTVSEIQLEHLQLLQDCSPAGLLFSDYLVEVIDSNDNLVEQEESVSAQLDISWQKTWNWNIAPIPEYTKNQALRLKMGALIF